MRFGQGQLRVKDINANPVCVGDVNWVERMGTLKAFVHGHI